MNINLGMAQCRMYNCVVFSSDCSLMALSQNISSVFPPPLSPSPPLLPAGYGYLHISQSGTEMHQCLPCLLVLHN